MNVKIKDYIYEKKPIGIGSFAKVYKGFNHITKDVIAIKKINLLKLNKILKDRLTIEIELMQKYNDNINILKLYDVLYSENKDYLYMILEYCDCGDLNNFIKNNKLTENEIKYYMNQLKNGLQYLRENNIIHRDIKPKNILLTDNNKILKICDFGFARSVMDDVSLMETLCGSPLYMAPEIINNKKYNIKSDLWSVGIILYEMVYHDHPLGDPVNIIDLMDRLKNRRIVFPQTDISNICIKLLEKLLQTDICKRIEWIDFFNNKWFDNVIECYVSNNELLFDMEMDDMNGSVVIHKSNYDLDNIINENHISVYFNEEKDDIYEMINKNDVQYVGSVPIEQNCKSYNNTTILKNSLSYLSSSLQYIKNSPSKLLNLF